MHERLLHIPLELGDHTVLSYSVYLSVQSDTAGRAEVLEVASKCYNEMKQAQQWWHGDWNGHIGKDTMDGTFAMVTPTTLGGKPVQRWLLSPPPMRNIDEHIRFPQRATRQRSMDKYMV